MLVNISLYYYLPLMSFATLSGRNYYPLSPEIGDSRNTFQAPPSAKEWTSQEQKGSKLFTPLGAFSAGSPHPVNGRLLPANPDLFNCERAVGDILTQGRIYRSITETNDSSYNPKQFLRRQHEGSSYRSWHIRTFNGILP